MVVGWRNWGGNQASAPAEVAHPADVADLIDVVKGASGRGVAVKPIGSGHSFTAIGVTDGVQVQFDRYDRLLSVDAEAGRVTVQAGLQLHRLNELLTERGLALTNMGDIDVQTVAGAISTGTHGTGRDSGAIAAQIAGLELVLADGSVVQCSREERPDLFAAARVGLGALGVLSTVTFAVEPLFHLRAQEEPMPLGDVLDGFEELITGNEHFEYYWFPGTDVALTKRNNRVPGPARPLSRTRGYVDDMLLANHVFEATCRLCAAAPRLIPTVNRIAAKALSAREYVDVNHKVFTSPRQVRFVEMEYAIPRAELPAVFRAVQAMIARRGHLISFPVEVRVAPADDIWLSTASGRDTAYVAFHVFRGTDFEPYFRDVEAIMNTVAGRPHWGKMHWQTAASLRERYPHFDEFVALRDRLDPTGLFANPYLDRVLGPVGR